MFEDLEVVETAMRLLDDDQVRKLAEMCRYEVARRNIGDFTATSAAGFNLQAHQTATQIQAQQAQAQTRINHLARQMVDNAQLNNFSTKWNWFGK